VPPDAPQFDPILSRPGKVGRAPLLERAFHEDHGHLVLAKPITADHLDPFADAQHERRRRGGRVQSPLVIVLVAGLLLDEGEALASCGVPGGAPSLATSCLGTPTTGSASYRRRR